MDDAAVLRRAVMLVALLNLSYFGVEFAVALSIGSVSLFADSIDFLEDASVNGLILVALGWNARLRSMVGMLLAGVLLAPPSLPCGRRGKNSISLFLRRCSSRLPGWVRLRSICSVPFVSSVSEPI